MTTGTLALASDREVILRSALNAWSEEDQRWMFIEEAGELLSALGKFRRGRVDKDAVIDEIADVQIILWQLALMHDTRLVEAAVIRKMDRLEERVKLHREGRRGKP